MLDQISEGYGFYSSAVLDTAISADEARRAIERAVERFTYAPSDFENLSPSDRMPLKAIFADSRYLLFDLAVIPEYLPAVFRSVGALQGQRGNVRGANFEREVNAVVTTNTDIVPWLHGRTLKTPEGPREVDLSLLADTTLYLVECKASAANPRVLRGDHAAVKARWEEFRKHSDQARTVREVLEQHRKGSNYQVPATLMAFEHCVCAPLPEWIPETGPDYWLTDTMPRICTPQELLEYISARATTTPG